MTRETFTIEEAAEVLGVGRNTAYEAARRGEIPSIRLGRRILVPKAALERMLESGNGDPLDRNGDLDSESRGGRWDMSGGQRGRRGNGRLGRLGGAATIS